MDHLTTESRNPASERLDELSPLQIVELMNSEDARVAPAVAAVAPEIARAIEVVSDRLRHGGRLIYVGAGTSGRLGVLDATECPPTFQSPPGQVIGLIAGGPPALTQAVEGAEDRPKLAADDLRAVNVSNSDIVVGIATSGRTPYVLEAMRCARQLQAFTIGLSCNPDSELDSEVDLAISPIVGPEILTGSTRLKAGTATKLVLNMITTGAMIRLGKTYGNLMVDLKATNIKLLARANRIVRQVSGMDADAAAELLKRCRGEVKTAIVSHHLSIDPEEARKRLASVDGRVRDALGIRREDRPIRSATTPLVIGIDGGGSHTIALLAEAHAGGAILGRGESGPSNIQSVGVERALAELDRCIESAFAAAGIERSRVAGAGLGLAGIDRQEGLDVIHGWANRVGLAGSIQVANDATLLLAAGTPNGWGLAIIAGTGSIAFGRTPDGRIDRAGGWGYTLGDEGSAYMLAIEALRAVARSSDGVLPPTQLTQAILKRFGLQTPAELIPAVYRGGWDRQKIATLAPLVLETAESDNVAAIIVQKAAADLADTALAAARKLDLPRTGLPLALTGGAILGNANYRQQFLDAVAARGLRVDPVTLVHDPAEGAVRIARSLVGAAS